MTVAITGGAGFIGAATVKAIRAESDEEIVCLDNLHPQVHGSDARPPAFLDEHDVRFVRMDITDRGAWDSLLAEIHPRTLIHLAAETGTGQSLLQAARHAQVNVYGTATMLDALAQAGRLPEHIVVPRRERCTERERGWKPRPEPASTPRPGGRRHCSQANGNPLGLADGVHTSWPTVPLPPSPDQRTSTRLRSSHKSTSSPHGRRVLASG